MDSTFFHRFHRGTHGIWFVRFARGCYRPVVALVRILVDGYSLLHAWPELAEGEPRHSAAAREALVRELTRYHDVVRTPITIFFDGSGAPAGTPKVPSSPEVEILYSKVGQTADQMIERVAYRMQKFGEVLAVTNDFAERDTVISLGGHAQSCEQFLYALAGARDELDADLKHHNRRERERFRHTR